MFSAHSARSVRAAWLPAKAARHPSNCYSEDEECGRWSEQDNQRSMKSIGSLSTFVVDDFKEFVRSIVCFSDLLLCFGSITHLHKVRRRLVHALDDLLSEFCSSRLLKKSAAFANEA